MITLERLDTIVCTVRKYVTSKLTETLVTENDKPTMIMSCKYKDQPLTLRLIYLPNSLEPLVITNENTKKEIKLHNMDNFIDDLESVC